MLTVFVIVIILLCVSMMLTEGMWSNSLSLINTIFSAIIASNYFEPVANFMDDQLPSYTYFWDFLSLWTLFALSFNVLRVMTDKISKAKVRFKLPVEQGGRVGFGLLTGWVVVCFFLFTLHTAPLARNCFGGGFGKSPTSSNFYLSPDRLWLGFLQSRSEGAMATSGGNAFDPRSEFILKYGERRQRFSETPKMRVDGQRRR